ncbi:MAG: putative capsid protein [Cressdnaviricota sp.]|nr:MAG: putative capsid protein [Cressdnaviricota sp.]
MAPRRKTRNSSYMRRSLFGVHALRSAIENAMSRSATKTVTQMDERLEGDSGHQTRVNRKVIKKRDGFREKAVRDAFCNCDLYAAADRIWADPGKQKVDELGAQVLDLQMITNYVTSGNNITRRFWMESTSHDIFITNTTATPIEVQFYWYGYREQSTSTATQIYAAGILEKYGNSAAQDNPQVALQESKLLMTNTRCYYAKTTHMSPGQVSKFHLHRDINRYYDTSTVDDVIDRNKFPGFTEGFMVRIHGTPVVNTAKTVVSLGSAAIAFTRNTKFRFRYPNGQAQELASNQVRQALSTAMVGELMMEEDTGVVQQNTFIKS